MSTIIMAPLCSIYISNILRALKCRLTAWLQIWRANAKIHLLPYSRSGLPDLVVTGEISWWKALVNDWSDNMGEEEQANPSSLLPSVIVTCLIRQTLPSPVKSHESVTDNKTLAAHICVQLKLLVHFRVSNGQCSGWVLLLRNPSAQQVWLHRNNVGITIP